jgi:hypothetical protein
LKFCVPAKVTIPVSCGRGVLRNKRHHQQGKFNKKSPAPPKASVTFSAMSFASYRSLSKIVAGCQLS